MSLQNKIAALLVATLLALPGVHAQTYWLNSQYNEAEEHYPTAEEACLEGELQRRLEIHQAGNSWNSKPL